MLWRILFWIISCGISNAANAQEFAKKCNTVDNHTEEILCIRHYNDLEMYVMDNNTLMEKLAETFFSSRTTAFFNGRGATDFVKTTYNFYTGNSKQTVEDNNINCSGQQITYIWSVAGLYLGGPDALYWMTLFAISITEVSVTIELPCIFDDVYSTLLSRLTYLVSLMKNMHCVLIKFMLVHSYIFNYYY